MSKKVISILLSAAMLVAMLCVGAGAVTASAADSNTYYFLAPDNFFKSEAGAVNDKVGVYWWQPSENAAWPGAEMTAAPEVGDNVFKVEGVGSDTTTIIFNAFVDAGNPADPELAKVAHQTVNINTEGYDGDAPYDENLVTDDFNGWIYVLDCNAKDVNEFSQAETTGGAWFKLDDYKSNEQYYGSYGFSAEETTDSEAPAEETTDSEAPAETDSEAPAETDSEAPAADGQAIKAGETITVQVTVGDVKIDGEAAKLGAYNYDVNYNADVLEYVEGKDETTGGMPLVNANTAGTVKLATMAALGLTEDFSGEKAPVYTLTFKTTKDTTEGELGLTGKCTSLTAVTADGSNTKTLIGVNNPDDSLTALKITLPEVEEPTPSVPTSSVPSSSVPSSSTPSSSKPASSSQASSKATPDNASSSSKGSTSTAKAATTTTTTTAAAPVQTAGTFAVVSLVVILMAAAAVVLYTRKKTEE